MFRKYLLAVLPTAWHEAAIKLLDAGINPVQIAVWVLEYREELAAVVQRLIDAYQSLPVPPMFAGKGCDADLQDRLECLQCNLACAMLDTLWICDKLGCCPAPDVPPPA